MDFQKKFELNLGFQDTDMHLMKELNQVMEMKGTGIMLNEEDESDIDDH